MTTQQFVIRNQNNVNGVVQELLNRTKLSLLRRQGNGNYVGQITDQEIIIYISNYIKYLITNIKNHNNLKINFVGIFLESDFVNVVSRSEESNEPIMWFILKAYVLYIIKNIGYASVPKAALAPVSKAAVTPVSKAAVVPVVPVPVPKAAISKATPAPNAAVPKVVVPKTVAPKTSAPIVVAPKMSAPIVVAPKTSAPKVVVPKTSAPIVVAPKTSAPKVVVPKTSAPIVVAPKVVVPKAPASKTSAPKAPTSKTSAPKASVPKPQDIFIDPIALKEFMSSVKKNGSFFSLDVNTNRTDLTQESIENITNDANIKLLISYDHQTKIIKLMTNKIDEIQNALQVFVNHKIITIEIKTEVYQKSEDIKEPDNKLKSMIYAYLDGLDSKEEEKEKEKEKERKDEENAEQIVLDGSDMSSDDDILDNDNSTVSPPKAQKRLKVSQKKAAKDKDKRKNRSDDNGDFKASSTFNNRKKSNEGIDYEEVIEKLQGPNPEFLIGLINQFANGKYINVDTKNGSKIGVLSGSMRNSQRINRLAKGDFVLCSIRGNMSSSKFGSQDGTKVDVFYKINGHLANQLCADRLIPRELGKQQERMIIGDTYDDEFDDFDIVFDSSAKTLIPVSNDDDDNTTMQFEFDISTTFSKRSKPSEKTKKLSETSRRESRDKKNEV
jgi:hypothetical protein